MPTTQTRIRQAVDAMFFQLRSIGVADAYDAFWSTALDAFSVHHPTRNSIHWGAASWKLLKESVYAYASMDTHANIYRENVSEGSFPSSTHGLVSYYADDCVVRLDSIKDKLALAAWCLYDVVDPTTRVYTCEDVIESFRTYARTGENRELWIDQIVATLETLSGGPWDFIEEMRHLKIHRLEPRIEIYGAATFHESTYLQPANNHSVEAKLRTRINRRYGSGELARIVLEGCRVDGILYSEENAQNVYSYDDVRTNCYQCIESAANALASCLRMVEAELSQIS